MSTVEKLSLNSFYLQNCRLSWDSERYRGQVTVLTVHPRPLLARAGRRQWVKGCNKCPSTSPWHHHNCSSSQKGGRCCSQNAIKTKDKRWKKICLFMIAWHPWWGCEPRQGAEMCIEISSSFIAHKIIYDTFIGKYFSMLTSMAQVNI